MKSASVLTVCFILYAAIGEWFVHHPRKWLDRYEQGYPAIASALEAVGNPMADLTDSLGLTGNDCVYEYDTPAPAGEVLFAGVPQRTGEPAPDDIVIIDRGEFVVGWSRQLKHPAWVAYHVTKDPRHPAGTRPKFSFDRQAPGCPQPGDYTHSGYDRGHMAPNYAIATRYGKTQQLRTFLMSNIAPQTGELNRGAWRELEHRIADYWTRRYGEIWVIVGGFSEPGQTATIGTSGIDVPQNFYMLIVAQENLDVRAMAVVLPQKIDFRAYAARYLVSIDELEERTGFDFLPDLPEFIGSPLEAELPTRLWPVCWQDVIPQLFLHYSKAF